MRELAQSTDSVVMIRPQAFGFNPETAASNRYQAQEPPPDDQRAAAVEEFDGLVAALTEAGVNVVVFDDTPTPVTPDALFPNNWFSTHADGRFVTYPMLAPSRRAERRDDIPASLAADHGFVITETLSFAALEDDDIVVEGTGSLVLDRINGIAYACLADRTDAAGVAEICAALEFRPETFRAVDPGGAPIYHTNVCLAIGTNWAIICAEAITDGAERDRILGSLAASGREIVTISQAQVSRFCGNALELQSRSGATLIAMSSQAAAAFDDAQRLTLGRHGRIVHADIGRIEALAGGSVRCMLAELFLPRR
ncbi:MAG: arginine deiminase-related protein [Pseudomonadota bacterium]